MPPLSLRKCLIEDFVNLHCRSIDQAMASALHVEDPPFDFSKRFAFFSLSYYPESGGNPSTAFVLDSVDFHDNPAPNDPVAENFEAFRPLAEASDEGDRGRQGYLGLLICVYVIDNELMWMSASPIFDYYLCKGITDHGGWFWRLKYTMHKGLVFRLGEGPDKENWRPGVMKQDGSRWLWKEKSIEELHAYDIHLSQGPDND